MIDTDPAIGCALKVEGMNVEDFIDRKRAEIEGLMAGAGALMELERVGAGWNELCHAAGTSTREKLGLEPVRTSESHQVARELLQSAQLALQELYTVAQTLARRHRESRTESVKGPN